MSLRIFQFVVTHSVKGFTIVSENRSRWFSETSLLSPSSYECWQFHLWFSAFSKSRLYIWKFSVHVLLKCSLKDFEHNLARMWNECNCTVVWTFLGFPGGSDGKASACNAGDLGLSPGSGKSPGEGNGNPFQYSCLENPMNRGVW